MLYPILIFIFGTIIGSFLNVVILRYNSGMSLGGRSGCFSCGKPLTWKELIPLLSFFYQRRKCVGCGSAISWQYPAVEALTGLSFVLIFYKYFGNDLILSAERVSSALIYAVIFCLLIVIAVYDMRHKIIPNGPVYLFITLSFVSTILFPLFFYIVVHVRRDVDGVRRRQDRLGYWMAVRASSGIHGSGLGILHWRGIRSQRNSGRKSDFQVAHCKGIEH